MWTLKEITTNVKRPKMQTNIKKNTALSQCRWFLTERGDLSKWKNKMHRRNTCEMFFLREVSIIHMWQSHAMWCCMKIFVLRWIKPFRHVEIPKDLKDTDCESMFPFWVRFAKRILWLRLEKVTATNGIHFLLKQRFHVWFMNSLNWLLEPFGLLVILFVCPRLHRRETNALYPAY